MQEHAVTPFTSDWALLTLPEVDAFDVSDGVPGLRNLHATARNRNVHFKDERLRDC
jgi:hypothetical protein